MNKGENPIIVLLIVAVLAVAGLWSLKNSPVSTVPTRETTQTTRNIGYTTRYTKNNPINNPTYQQPLTPYAQALLDYKDARIQLNKNCQASPSYVTYKNNTNVMIDNRSDVARVVKVGSVYNIEPYGFKVIRLSSSIVPIAWYVDCDKSQNVATILVQE